jgi:predicted metal-dependent hydrolase
VINESAERQINLDLGGRAVPLRVRRHRRARNMILRIDTANDGALLTLPWRTPLADGLGLARSKASWILRGLDALPPRMPFADGALVPYLGVVHRVRHRPDARGVAWRDDGEINVSGRPEHLARRLTDWLRRQARSEIVPRVAAKAASLERQPGRIVLRDTRSRWGSCSANGDLSFCWRLVMATEPVLDYVVAHEVAHLAYRGHGPRFWSTVARLTDGADDARAWLRQNGEGLHRYG